MQEARYLGKIAEIENCRAATDQVNFALPKSRLRNLLVVADCMWEKEQLIPGLEKIVSVTLFDLRNALLTKRPGVSPEAATLQALSQFVSHSNEFFDLVLLYSRPSLLSEEIFSLLRNKWSCPIFGMNLDDKTEFFPTSLYSDQRDNYARWARNFDLNLSSTLAASDWYAQANASYCYLGMGFHPKEPAAENLVRAREIAFVGSKRLERQELVDRLANYGVAIQTYGLGWSDSHHWVEDAARIYQQSQISLGLGFATASGRMTSLKARDYECPGAGGCYLTTYNWELALQFEVGKEILCYRNVEELAEMAFWWLKRPERCREVALAGQKRCLREYTWEARFRKVFSESGFNL